MWKEKEKGRERMSEEESNLERESTIQNEKEKRKKNGKF